MNTSDKSSGHGRSGDRRRHPRFEVVGSMCGWLEIIEQVPLINISPTGALIVSPVPVQQGQTLSLTVGIDGPARQVQAEVRHVSPVADPAHGSLEYQVGLSLSTDPIAADRAAVAT